MVMFATKALGKTPDVVAPDGSEVRVLLANHGASVAHFTLQSGQVSIAVRHRSIDEIWYFVGGCGKIWRHLDNVESTIEVAAGVCISIPVGTAFQFRANRDSTLSAIGVSSPPWPGLNDETTEAELVTGLWTPTVAQKPS